MAATATGAELTAAQAAQQARINKMAIAELIPLWRLLDPLNIDGSSPAWVRLVLELIARFRGQSASTAADYYLALRAAETDQLVDPMLPRVQMNPQQVLTSLMVTGPIGIKTRIGKGVDPEKAKRLALVEASGAVARHVLDGGRQQLVQAVESDIEAVGFARVTGPHPCSFCLLLASRGFAYKSRESAVTTGRRSKRGMGQPFHDHDQCTVEPTFSRHAPLPPSAQRAEDLYVQATESGARGTKAILAEMDRLRAQQTATAA